MVLEVQRLYCGHINFRLYINVTFIWETSFESRKVIKWLSPLALFLSEIFNDAET